MSRNSVLNTATEISGPLGLGVLLESMAGGSPLERMVAQGQRELVHSEVLPTSGTEHPEDAKRWASIGVILGDKVPGDEIFRYATLPARWTKKPTDHSMWSDIVDDKGRVRARIFYKASFYDRNAAVRLERRYRVTIETEDGSYNYEEPHHGIVLDCGTEIHRTRLTVEADLTMDQCDRTRSHGEAARWMAEVWLDANFPDWHSVTAYWD